MSDKLNTLLEEEFDGEFDNSDLEAPITESDADETELTDSEEEKFTVDDDKFQSTALNFTTE